MKYIFIIIAISFIYSNGFSDELPSAYLQSVIRSKHDLEGIFIKVDKSRFITGSGTEFRDIEALAKFVDLNKDKFMFILTIDVKRPDRMQLALQALQALQILQKHSLQFSFRVDGSEETGSDSGLSDKAGLNLKCD